MNFLHLLPLIYNIFLTELEYSNDDSAAQPSKGQCYQCNFLGKNFWNFKIVRLKVAVYHQICVVDYGVSCTELRKHRKYCSLSPFPVCYNYYCNLVFFGSEDICK